MGLCAVLAAPALGAVLPDSERLGHAKDLIGDEQWQPAIRELKAAAADPAESSQDEVLFWLAHCQNQTRDAAAAVDTIQRLERGYPRSPWLKPARSLRIEIAQRLRRNDVLWFTAAPPPPPEAPPAPPAPPAPSAVRTPPPAAVSAVPPTPPVPPLPADPWMPERFMADTDLRIQALGSLMQTDAVRVIPMLRDIALTGHDADEARRALFMLAQSHRPEARATVVEMATSGPELVRVAAVRALGGLGGPAVSSELLRVYATANERVKYQVVLSLGQRDAVPALMHIAQSETDARLRDAAIVRLGEAGGRAELAQLYARQRASAADMKKPIIAGLFNARADDELIRLAQRETDPAVKAEILARLRLLGTPAARAYLAARPR
ncbi:MAG: HEAT repeat domain-containing protein [Acidobacteriota bacterium]